MSVLPQYASTIWKLGVFNIIRIIVYRIGVQSGLSPVRRLNSRRPSGPFFVPATKLTGDQLVARSGWFEQFEAFGQSLGSIEQNPPDWNANCLNGQKFPDVEKDWWKIPDFELRIGDIKTVWEFSRFDWVLACAQQSVTGNEQALNRLELWLQNWCAMNPPYKGPNWKCGQEASIRVMHLLAATLLMRQSKPTPGLLELVRVHVCRIAPTIQYAIAQDNNHGTSEAAALFAGGSFLAAHGDASGNAWMDVGRKWLENRAERLIAKDGGFSQYSLNYHRVVLDTYTFVEIWRRKYNLENFSPKFYQRCRAATHWLYTMVNPENGDGPNLGSNDGARLFPLTDSDFRDYRPSIQLASAVYLDSMAFQETEGCNQPLYWFGIEKPFSKLEKPTSRQFDHSGYTVLRNENVMVMLRYPRYRFRPCQCDALHVDLWIGGDNWLRDDGTYSYNADCDWQNYFASVSAHNTIQFDDTAQMPRIRRFLFGDWLQSSEIDSLQMTETAQSFGVGYEDKKRRRHKRTITLCDDSLEVEDNVSGFAHKAVLRWRLKPEHWVIDRKNKSLSCAGFTLHIDSDVPILRMELCKGWESRYYLHKDELPVLEVEIAQAGKLTSTMSWRSV